jgi:GT2 family glycosyltransferase
VSPRLSPRHSVVVNVDGATREAFEASAASIHGQLAGHVELVECRPHTAGRVTALNDALRRSAGEFIAFVDAGDVLHPHALAAVDHRFIENPETDFVYTDEDRLAGNVRLDPFYKPAWSPDRMRCQMYTGRLAVMRRAVVEQVGSFREELTGAHEYDLALRVCERARRVEHVPDVFFHRGSDTPLTGIENSPRGRQAGLRAIDEHLRRTGFPAEVELDAQTSTYRLRPALDDEPLVSIVIPTNGAQRRVYGRNIDLVVNCVRSIVERSTYKNYEIVCVIDDDTPPNTKQALPAAAQGRIRFVRYPHEFNFSRKINIGALHSSGEYFLLLNDDTEVITPEWIEHLLMYAQQPGVGAAGATLLFADGRIQHAGVVILNGDPGHPYYAFPGDWEGYFSNLRVPCNYLGVTAACLMSRRDVFEEVGGLSLSFPLNYNDVDYGMKLHAAGYRVLCTPEAKLHHFESSSRGPGEVADEEKDLLHSRWRNALMRDPFYSPHFLRTADFLTLAGVGGATPAELRV